MPALAHRSFTISLVFIALRAAHTFTRCLPFQEPAQQDKLARLKHRLDQQQSKLNRLRLLRSQTDQSRANNATLSKSSLFFPLPLSIYLPFIYLSGHLLIHVLLFRSFAHIFLGKVCRLTIAWPCSCSFFVPFNSYPSSAFVVRIDASVSFQFSKAMRSAWSLVN